MIYSLIADLSICKNPFVYWLFG